MADNLQIISKDKYHHGKQARNLLYKRFSIIFLLTVILIILIGSISQNVPNNSFRIMWFVTGACGLFIIWLIKTVLDLDWLMPPVIYGFVFWLFHFGLLFPASIYLDMLDLWAKKWVFNSDTIPALLISLLFLSSYALGILTSYKSNQTKLKRTKEDVASELVFIGWVLISLSLVLFVIALYRFGWNIFLISYYQEGIQRDFFSVHNSFSFPVFIYATGVMMQIAGGQTTKSILKLLVIFFLLTLPLLLGGARTAPLISSVAIMSLLALRDVRIPVKLLIPTFILLLTTIATIRSFRVQGVEAYLDRGGNLERTDPLSGLAELGGSLKPVVVSIDYIRNRGEFFDGETYLFPLIRQLQRFSGTRRTIETDERFIAQRISYLHGAIGYSTAAEAYVNGSFLGVVLFAFGWGAWLGWLTNKATTPYRLALLAIFMIPMLTNIRNSFIFVPAWLAFGLLVIIIARLLRKRTFKNIIPRTT